MNSHFITLMILLPFFGAVAQLVLAERNDEQSVMGKWIAVGCSGLAGLLGVILVLSMKGQGGTLEASQQVPWIGSYAISYSVGLDGLNAVVLLLLSILFPLILCFEWNQERSIKGLFGLTLMLQSSLIGAVCAQDLFLLFFFWSVSSLPVFFMISIWGENHKEKAAFYYIMSSFIGNALLLISLVLIYYSVSPYTFSIQEISQRGIGKVATSFLGIEIDMATLAFVFLLLGLALRIPVAPFHGWLSYGATQVPASVVILITGSIVPVGIYIFSKVGFSLFTAELERYETVIIAFGAFNLVYSVFNAAIQREFRQFLVFLCLAQVGLLIMGLGSREEEGVVGATFQLFTVGLGIAGLGMFSGMLFDRSGSFNFVDSQEETGYWRTCFQGTNFILFSGSVSDLFFRPSRYGRICRASVSNDGKLYGKPIGSSADWIMRPCDDFWGICDVSADFFWRSQTGGHRRCVCKRKRSIGSCGGSTLYFRNLSEADFRT